MTRFENGTPPGVLDAVSGLKSACADWAGSASHPSPAGAACRMVQQGGPYPDPSHEGVAVGIVVAVLVYAAWRGLVGAALLAARGADWLIARRRRARPPAA